MVPVNIVWHASVDDRWPVSSLISPAAAILGIGSEPPDDTAFRDRVLDVAEGLTESRNG